MDLDQAFRRLRAARVSVPTTPRLPTAAEVADAERTLNVAFHPGYRRYLLEASDITCGVVEPFVLTAPGSHVDIIPCVRRAWASGVPRNKLPFCEDNGSYYCLDGEGSVSYWAHDGVTDETWPSLAVWIDAVWLNRT
jgi:hypothetical protein